MDQRLSKDVVSILYLRCDILPPHEHRRFCKRFNSLFEMPRPHINADLVAEKYGFNSLFEMLRAESLVSVHRPDQVSILYIEMRDLHPRRHWSPHRGGCFNSLFEMHDTIEGPTH